MPERIKRAILKASGELFSDESNHISFPQYDLVARQIIEITQVTGLQLAVVVGGGNIFRGREAHSEVDHSEADHMGMLATIINGIGLHEALVRNGAKDPRLMSAVGVNTFAEPFIRNKGIHHLDNNKIVVIAGGLGQPNFSTDSAVAQYADELLCKIILKASTVDGVYDSDPRKKPDAKRYSQISYRQAMIDQLGIMDQTAFAMCMKSEIPIFVFNAKDLSKIPEIVNGDHSFGTLISSSAPSPDSP